MSEVESISYPCNLCKSNEQLQIREYDILSNIDVVHK